MESKDFNKRNNDFNISPAIIIKRAQSGLEIGNFNKISSLNTMNQNILLHQVNKDDNFINREQLNNPFNQGKNSLLENEKIINHKLDQILKNNQLLTNIIHQQNTKQKKQYDELNNKYNQLLQNVSELKNVLLNDVKESKNSFQKLSDKVNKILEGKSNLEEENYLSNPKSGFMKVSIQASKDLNDNSKLKSKEIILEEVNNLSFIPKSNESNESPEETILNHLSRSKILGKHDNNVMCLDKTEDDKLVSVSLDKNIIIWDIKTEKEIKRIKTNFQIFCLSILSNDSIVTGGSDDGILRLWNLNTGQYRPIKIHEMSIYNITRLSNNFLATGSLDKTIKILKNFNNLESNDDYICEGTLTGHNGSINSICELSKDLIVSGSQDTTIKIWTLSTFDCIWTLKGHSDAVRSVIKVSKDLIASCSSDKSIKLWKIDRGECTSNIKMDNSNQTFLTLCLLSDNFFVCGGTGKSLKVFKLNSPHNAEIIKDLNGHQNSINYILDLKNGKIATGSRDNSISIWNLNDFLN